MNCPRCKHGSTRLDAGFCCGNCFATFLADGATASAEPLVREVTAGCFEVRRRVGVDRGAVVMLMVSLILLGALAVSSVRQTGGDRSGLWFLMLVFFGLAAVAADGLLNDKFGRLSLQANQTGLTVVDGWFGWVKPRRLERDSIDGFWVRCTVDEYGRGDPYALMIDQDGKRSRELFGGAAQLCPLVVLAEKLAANLHVPSDTRGSEFQ